ncbi:MAG: diguanylate cyclase with sensor [Holophagaceae bacterium]|nr:diguanylate cyclase with sensor [Holophagaceae bacterium]
MTKPRRTERHTRPRENGLRTDHLSALGALVEKAFPNPGELFCHGLELLVQQLGVERAVMTRLGDLGFEAFWWATADGSLPDPSIHRVSEGFCPRVLEAPTRTLVIKDATLDPHWKNHSGWKTLGIRAYIGAPLRQTGKIIGTLNVQSTRPKEFSRAEVAMVNAMANLFSKTLEVETLKQELRMTRDALDLTTAVVEDSALECYDSGLPNMHYLDIWLKANLYLARRRGECMSVVRWDLPLSRESAKQLKTVADALRGEDLLVDMGHDKFLLLLPRTPKDGAQILLERIRARIGAVPMGATLWDPARDPDRQDFTAHHAVHRAQEALKVATGTEETWMIEDVPLQE